MGQDQSRITVLALTGILLPHACAAICRALCDLQLRQFSIAWTSGFAHSDKLNTACAAPKGDTNVNKTVNKTDAKPTEAEDTNRLCVTISKVRHETGSWHVTVPSNSQIARVYQI